MSFFLLFKKNNNYYNGLFSDEFYENLYINQQLLVTSHAIHDTLIYIIFNEGAQDNDHTLNMVILFFISLIIKIELL